jgi:hypothetical protein
MNRHMTALLLVPIVAGALAVVEASERASAVSPAVSPKSLAVGVGGRMVAVDNSTFTAGHSIAAADNGGLWRTTDSGASWSHLDNLLPTTMSDVRYGPGTHVVIATVGFDSTVRARGANLNVGIWVSGDDGTTWTQANVPRPTGRTCAEPTPAWGISWSRVAGNTGHVYIGTDCGLAVSDDAGATWRLVDVTSSSGLDAVYSVIAHTSISDLVHVCGNFGYRRARRDGPNTWFITTAGGTEVPSGSCYASIGSAWTHATDMVFTNTATGSVGALYVTPLNHRLYQQRFGSSGWTDITTPVCPAQPVCATANGLGNRNPFVRVYPARGDSNSFDLYYGTGSQLFRTRCSRTLLCSSSSTWVKVVNDQGQVYPTNIFHPDPTDLALNTSNLCPNYVASDGGLAKFNSPPSATTCAIGGSNIGAEKGLDAVEINEVAGDPRSTTSRDLYFSTQDNNFWASTNDGASWPTDFCCEGASIQVPANANPGVGRPVTFNDCGPGGTCTNAMSDRAFAPPRPNWPNPATSCNSNQYLDPGSDSGSSNSTWLQFANPATTGCSLTRFQLWRGLKTGSGITWNRLLTLGAGTECHPTLVGCRIASGRPRFSGPANNPTLYVAIYKPENSARVGLVRIDNALTGAPAFRRADTGLGSISTYSLSSGFVYQSPVFEVDPFNPDHLVAGDQTSHTMKETWDGGKSWTSTFLTSLVTGLGHYLFDSAVDPGNGRTHYAQAHVISFDPTVRDRIFVGTDQNGIIATSDGGEHWGLIPGTSGRLTGVSGIFSDPEAASATTDAQVVSSFGRGLWNMTFGRSNLQLQSSPASPSTIPTGGTTSVTFTVHNDGTQTAEHPSVTIAFDTSESFVPAGSSNLCTSATARSAGRLGPGNRVTCSVGALAAGATRTFTVKIQASLSGFYGITGYLSDAELTDPIVPNTGGAIVHVT